MKFSSTNRRLRSGAWVLLLLGATATVTAAVQETADAPASKHFGRPMQIVRESPLDPQVWAERLTDLDMDARELAFNELVSSAAKDVQLRQALQSWSNAAERPELAWTARLALRDLTREQGPRRLAWVRRNHVLPRGLAVFVPPGSTQQDAPAAAGQNLLRRPPLDAAFPLDGSHQVSLQAPRAVGFPSAHTALPVPQRQVNVILHPEGVVLVIRDVFMGRSTKRTYAGESLEKVLQMHPVLLQQVPGLLGLSQLPLVPGRRVELRGGGGVLQVAVAPVPGATPAARQSSPAGRVILGVQCIPLSEQEAQRRSLGPGVGLFIERREPGSVAEALGLQRGDILVELLGQTLCSFEEISRVLAENHKPFITVKLVDHNGIERIRTWAPAAGDRK